MEFQIRDCDGQREKIPLDTTRTVPNAACLGGDTEIDLKPEVSKTLKSLTNPTSAKTNGNIVDWTVTVSKKNDGQKSTEKMLNVRSAGLLNAGKIELDKHNEIKLEPEVRKIFKSPMKPTSATVNDKKDDRTNAASKKRSSQRSTEEVLNIKRAGPATADKIELEKHLQNIRNILIHSNATPIRRHTAVGYHCSFCLEHFTFARDLKMHTLNHDKETKSTIMKGCKLSEYVVKLDITGLKCEICDLDIVGLEPLMNHLQSDHNKIIHTDIKNHILPFIFEGNTLKCVLCPKFYENFKLIQEHMNVHYDNYICETCNSCFVRKITLNKHVATHKQGQFSCKLCPKVFDTNAKKLYHEKFVHILDRKRSKCPHCGKKFSCYMQRDEHMVKEHGAEPRVHKCMACDKTFTRRDLLLRHTKRDHLLEREHGCEHCDKKFYEKKELNMHMLKHTGEKKYKCDVCSKAFGRRYTLKEHLRIHADDRRFKCEQCGQAFVQKCSWRNHMWSRHHERA